MGSIKKIIENVFYLLKKSFFQNLMLRCVEGIWGKE